MSRLKVVVTDYIFPNIDPEKEVLAAIGAEVVGKQCKTEDDLIEAARDADALLNCYFRPVSGKVLDGCPKVRCVVRYGIGVDSIDIPAATARGVLVANVPDYCLEEVSNHTVAMLLCLVRKIALADRRVRRGEWSLNCVKPLKPLREATVGVVGFGRIGRLTARKASTFGVRVVFYDPFIKADVDLGGLTARCVDLDTLLAESDAILLHAPATPETHHLLDAQAFAKMARKPVVVNTAREALVDTEALVAALRSGQVSGAALDLVEGFPPVNTSHPLFEFENVIITPHSAWYSEAALRLSQQLGAEEVARVLRGERPKSFLNPEAWERRRGR